MKNYMTVQEIKDNIDFVNLAITLKNIDAKSREDMKLVCEEEDLNIENLTSNLQIHSDIVTLINKDNIGQKIEGDALITNINKVPLLIFTADCVPIGIIDKKNKAIGVVHAGWRGTYDKIAQKTIEKMSKEFNTNPKDLICVIGPSIGPCCYEVSEELVEKFNTNFTNCNEKFYIIRNNKYYLDLWKINEYILETSGVKKENIINLNLCTSCKHDEFHSYRKHNQTTKRIGMIMEIK
ncbi:peptidoglycan editing factor PgeF [Romboutsia sp.]|uniref:peptidoglycan editing factor PgeF n=1 Tax=Romboutsia sp. TaxID=1965302 RepID=UPI003F3BD157